MEHQPRLSTLFVWKGLLQQLVVLRAETTFKKLHGLRELLSAYVMLCLILSLNITIIISFTEPWMTWMLSAWCCMAQRQSVIGLFMPSLFVSLLLYHCCFFSMHGRAACVVSSPYLCAVFVCHHHSLPIIVDVWNPLPCISRPPCLHLVRIPFRAFIHPRLCKHPSIGR